MVQVECREDLGQDDTTRVAILYNELDAWEELGVTWESYTRELLGVIH